VGLGRAIKGFFSGFRRGVQAHRIPGDERILRDQSSQSMPEGISQAEFRPWLEAGKTIAKGLAAKLLWLLKAISVLFGLVVVVALSVLLFWAALSGIRWLWEHPLW